jgi:hypothetical protein
MNLLELLCTIWTVAVNQTLACVGYVNYFRNKLLIDNVHFKE